MSTRLREALAAVGYSYDDVAALLGPVAHAALARNETMPGLRATRGGSPLETLVRLWPLQARGRRDERRTRHCPAWSGRCAAPGRRAGRRHAR